MNVHLKKLTFKMYAVSIVMLMALIFGIWLLSNSFLSVKISPRDALVFVDGEQVEVSELGFAKMRLSFGSHLLRAESDKYITAIKNLSMKRGLTNRQNITLKETPPEKNIAEGGKFLVGGINPNEIFFLGNDDSTIYRSKIGIDGETVTAFTTAITASDLYDIEDIIWSPKKDLALFKKSDGAYMFDFQKYNFVNQTETPWGEDIGDIAWSPDNSKIAYYYTPASGEKSLIFSNLDNSQKERILNLGDLNISDPILRWSPDSEKLMIIPRNQNENTNKLYIFNAYSRTLSEPFTFGNIQDGIFSADSAKVFYATIDPETSDQLISAIDIDGSNDFKFNLIGQIKSLFFPSQGNDILASAPDGEYSDESIFAFDIANNQQKDFSIKLPAGEPLEKLLLTADGQALVYESESGIFGMKLEQ